MNGYTEKLEDFGYREQDEAKDIFEAWKKNGLPKDFENYYFYLFLFSFRFFFSIFKFQFARAGVRRGGFVSRGSSSPSPGQL